VTELPGLAEHDFWDRILVDCPACDGLAIVTSEEPGRDWDNLAYGPRRMACTACSTVRRRPRAALSQPTLGLPLRLRGEGRHGMLYAYNEAHLDHIETYVRATLRREAVVPGGYRNKTVLSRLPRWVKAARNRDEVLKLIGRMRARLSGG
jgi:hypothetical protein